MEGINAGGAVQQSQRREARRHHQSPGQSGEGPAAPLVEISDAVTENFSSGVMERLGFGYDELRRLKPDIVYVSNSGFGKTGPYVGVQDVRSDRSGLLRVSPSPPGLPDLPPAGWGYSYMDHMGANLMAVAVLAGLVHRNRTGEGQWIDMACTEAGLTLAGPELLDFTVNGRPLRRPGSPNSNRANYPVWRPRDLPGRRRGLVGRHRLPGRRRLGAAGRRHR